MTENKTPKFTHLHLHTHYSLLDGLGKIDDILDEAKNLGMDSVAITDHGVMYGVPEFYEKAVERGVKPIIGCEFYVAPNGLENKRPKIDELRHHLILLAENNTGYKNLMKLVTAAHLEGYYYKPRIDLELIKKHSEGIIASSACIQGEIPYLVISKKYNEAKEKALEYQKIFGKDNFFLELQHLPNLAKQKVANDGLIKISKETEIPLIATADIHYVHQDDNNVQDVLLCIQMNKTVDDSNRMTMKDHKLHLKSPEEMTKHFKDNLEAIENTQKIANRCNVEIEFGNTKLPHFEVPKGHTADSYLLELCQKGFEKHYGKKEITGVHKERMEYELEIISKMGFASYFLIVQDFMNWAKNEGIIVGPGRGSAAGSFVSYLVGITNLDPIEYDLLFERFLNPDRISMPDVDADFADHRRDDVLQYVRKKYGEDHVAQIITFGTMAARAAIRDAGRALAVEYSYCDKLAKMVPMFTDLKSALEGSQELLTEYNENADAKKVIDAALRLEGVARHASVHACGVVITAKPVVEYSPLQYMAGKKGGEKAIVTQYSASSKSSYVEKIGLLKMDFLGLKNLTIIENALNIIKATTGDEIDIEKITLEDEETYKLLQKGLTTGVFQLESSGMKRYLKQLKPTVFEDIIAMVALYRPGPMEWIPDFIAGKHGEKRVTYLHPKLKPILENTYGVAVYQEQVMQIARDLAGFSGGEADILRKAMGKKIHELIKKEKEKFIVGCVENGISKEMAKKVFSFIEPFAGYGFNRSHAACYALIGYQTAYLKAHYPTQFMAALLNSDQDDNDRIAIEIEEAKTMGIQVLPPDVNESFKDFSVVINEKNPNEKVIRFGLVAIKGVGENIATQIIKERKKSGPYEDIIDLVERVADKDLNKKSIEALAMSGALNSITENNRNKIIQNIETILSYSKDFQKNASNGQTSLFGGDSAIELPKITLQDVSPASKKQMLSWEKELLGLYVSDHPLKGYQDYFAKRSTPIMKLERDHLNNIVTIGGIITKVQKIYTRRNELMYFVVIEDGMGKIEILVFPKVLKKNPDIWEEEKIILAKGKLSNKDNELKLLCEEAIVVDRKEMKKNKDKKSSGNAFTSSGNNSFSSNSTSSSFSSGNGFGNFDVPKPETENKKIITIFIETSDGKTQEILQKISGIISEAEKGESKIFIASRENPNQGKLEVPSRIKFEDELIGKLKEIAGTGNVEVK